MVGHKSALVLGASGVSGWSIVNEALHDYPKKDVWGAVHALTNRPVTQQDSLWPNDPRLDIQSGIDLLEGTQEELEAVINKQVKEVEKVTHVYYCAYKANTDLVEEHKEAVAMLTRSVLAFDHLCPKLEFFVVQTGVKMYGLHLLDKRPQELIIPPFKESAPKLPQPYYDQLFYNAQLDWIGEYARNKSWNWCDTRPDIIIGFHPSPNFYSLGQTLGIFFNLYKAKYGAGAKVPFPGSLDSWKAKSIDSSSDMIARQSIHVSLTTPKDKKGEGWNVVDAQHSETWETKWPVLCNYFGLVGVGPEDAPKGPEVRKFIKDNMDLWKKLEKEHGLRSGFADSDRAYPGFEIAIFDYFSFDREVDTTKMYGSGFTEERSILETWGDVWKRMKAAKIIPK